MYKMTSKQMFFIILGLVIVSQKTYPTIYIRNGGKDSWIATIIASIIILLYFILSIKVFKKSNCYDLYDIYCSSFGKILGNTFHIFYIISLILTLVECAGVESSAIHTNLLLETPIWYILIFMTVPAIYIVKKGTKSILSTTIIGIILMILAGINLAILTSTYKHITFILPMFQNVFTLGFWLCTLQILGLYAHVTLAYPYLEYVAKKDKLLKHGVLTMLFLIQMQIVSTLGVLMTFRVDRLNNLSYPKLTQTQLVSFLRFLESGELFVMLQTIGGWYVKYVLVLALTLKALKKIKIDGKYTIYIITLFIFAFTNYIADDLLLFFKYLNLYTYVSLINFFIIPLLAIIIFNFKNNRENKKKKAKSNSSQNSVNNQS
ncbi:endospore germination permease [Clostridium sp. MSJ-11]|uniref:Endospore germination permease n=1 Tax=Clostridium mobile TaxID=2841512 RepID=A0ABS6EJA0_9CLOT|nr:endospore germination permease [Clostridium mobile]MBU5485288.1 endospore germination permease [Clostridium mobile]